MPSSSYTLLCLGDSYTIGEMVPPKENFPNQTVQFLFKDGYDFDSPEIIAKTGWTSDELQAAVNKHSFKASYDFVTLLIGVNDQYRGRNVDEYKTQFESLLNQAIQFAKGMADHVIVLSIPDWGSTPFAKDRDRSKIGREIDAFNEANKQIAEQYSVQYIDITTGLREAANDPSLITSDGLHPSGKEYAKWAEKILEIIKSVIR